MRGQISRLHQHLVSRLKCSLTLEIFFDPVTLSTGITYEREALNSWFGENTVCPTTRKPLSIELLKKVDTTVVMKNFISNLLNEGIVKLEDIYLVNNLAYVLRSNKMEDNRERFLFYGKLWVAHAAQGLATLPAPYKNRSIAHYAVKYADVELIKGLGRHEPDALSVQLRGGHAAAHIAAQYGHDDIIKALHNIDPNLLKQRTVAGYTPAYIAIACGRVTVISTLLALGADLSKQRFKKANTIMHVAVEFELKELLLMFHVAYPNLLREKNADGQTPLELALMLDASSGVVALLLDLEMASNEGHHNRQCAPTTMEMDQQSDLDTNDRKQPAVVTRPGLFPPAFRFDRRRQTRPYVSHSSTSVLTDLDVNNLNHL